MLPCRLKKQFYPSGLNHDFPYHDLPYVDYIQQMRHVIAKTRIDLNNYPYDPHYIINANAPQQYEPKQPKRGVLLLHGLLESSTSLQSLFTHFQQQNYLVRSFLLPGHGTIPGDLTKVHVSAWIRGTRYAIDSFKQEVDKLIVVGFSTGASLALLDALHGAKIDALVLFAPALAIKHPLACFSSLHRTISWACHRARWLYLTTDDDYAKYQSLPFNAITQVRKLIKHNNKRLKKQGLAIPHYFILSDDDEVINSHAVVNLFRQHKQPDSHLLLYSNQHYDFSDPRIEVRTSADLKKNILDYSHPSLLIAPEHPHYGEQGDYIDFHHYKTYWGKPFNTHQQQTIHYGSLSKHNLENYHLCRLHYNPDFHRLMKDVDLFLDKVL